MLIVQKLYIKDFLRVFLILGLGISLLFSIIGFIDRFDELMPGNPSVFQLFKYIAFHVPKYLSFVMPMAILLSALFIFTQAKNRMEIVAIKSAGGKINQIMSPFLIIGFLMSLIGFFLSEIVVPVFSKEIYSIKKQLSKKDSRIVFREGTVFMKGKEGAVVRIALYLDDRDLARGVSIYKYDGDGLKEKIQAEIAHWDGGQWRLKNVNIFNVSEGRSIHKEDILSDVIESPKILQKESWKAEEMTIIELLQYEKRLNEAGFKNNKLAVDIASRFSYPLINFFMIILGLSLSTGAEKGLLQKILHAKPEGKYLSSGGIIATGFGLIISVVYWVGYTFFLSLGYAGTISPEIAAWVMPIAYSICSVYLYRQIPQ
jgi:lipopolysaccharide export system permease protein